MNVPSDLRDYLARMERAAGSAKLIQLPPLLNETAAAVAIAGHVDAALELWTLALQPEFRGIDWNAYGDGAIAALCHITGRPDLSHGEPRPPWARDAESRLKLADRVERHQHWVRQRLTTPRWSADQAKPRPKLPASEEFRRDLRRYLPALSLLRRDEATAIEKLRALAAQSRLPGDVRLEARILAIDFDARQDRIDAADQGLQVWYEEARQDDRSDAFAPLGLLPVARRLVAGALTEACGLPLDDCRRSVEAIAARVLGRLRSDEEVNPPNCFYSVPISHGTISLEPRVFSADEVYFQMEGDHARGYSIFGDHVCIAIPNDVRLVDVQVNVVGAEPGGSDLSLSLPVTDDLYLRTVGYHGDEYRFAVPSGTYRAHFTFSECDEVCEVRVELAPELHE